MFIDSDINTDAPYCDSDYLNHPGFLGICWKGKKKCEAERQSKKDDDVDNEYKIPSNADCEDLGYLMEDLQTEIDRLDAKNCSSRSCERVAKRARNSYADRFIDVEAIYRRKDCLQDELDESAEDFDEQVQKQFQKSVLRDELRKRDDNTLMYVALGVGIMTLGSIVILAKR